MKSAISGRTIIFSLKNSLKRSRLNKDLKDLDMRKNLEAKMALCEKTEELLLETSALRSSRNSRNTMKNGKTLDLFLLIKKMRSGNVLKTLQIKSMNAAGNIMQGLKMNNRKILKQK